MFTLKNQLDHTLLRTYMCLELSSLSKYVRMKVRLNRFL